MAEETTFTWDGAALAEQATVPAHGQAAGSAGQAPGHVITWDYQPGSFAPAAQAGRSSGWKQALQAFTIYFDGRIPTP